MTAIHADLKAAVEVETHAYLWTPSDGVDFIPRVCDKIFGDGRALLRLTTINSRPRFYVIRIDSAWKVDDSGAPDGGPDIWDHLEEIYEALEEQFGRVREIEDDELNGWPAFDHETGASWSRMDWPELPGVRLEPHPYAGHFTILGDQELQRERSVLEALRSDYLPPRVEAAGGGTGEDGCE